MANNNTEIEIKIPLDEQAFLELKEKLEKIAKFEKKSQQLDKYFTAPHRDFVGVKFPFEWLSIRERGGRSILCYKHFYPENAETHTHCDEFETEVASSGQLEKLFSALDFKSLVMVEKEREVYTFKEEFEIALDLVKELGHFIEIEAIKDFGTVEKTREKLFEFAKILGVDISKADKRGYPYALMKKNGLVE